MKHRKKKLCAVLSLILALCLVFSSCGFTGDDGDDDPVGKKSHTRVDEPEEGAQADTESTSMENVSYVLVYNPAVYYEYSESNDSLFSGNFGSQILVDADRAGEPLKEIPLLTVPHNMFNGALPELNPETDRANDLFTPYQAGDIKDFYASIPYLDSDRVSVDFECIATGEHANAWVPKGTNDVSAFAAQEVLDRFDREIYPTDTKLFGEARFAENGHKVNILFHNMPGTVAGYFTGLDLFSKYDRLAQSYIYSSTANFEHAIIHVNNNFVGSPENAETLYATVAHEFQHLICCSAFFENGGVTDAATWINEAMSGFVEEYMYPGIQEKDNRYWALHQSDLIRHGQSLFNFTTNNYDIGVYGSVFLFSEYLANQSGEAVFKKIHNSMRNASRGEGDASFLRNAVSPEFRNKIQNSVRYPKNFVRLDSDEEWLSKLALDFYLSMLKYDPGEAEAFEKVDARWLTYDELDGANIEGGGRVIIATKNGEFTIPEDADEGLIYIGLDEDFNVVTDYIFH